MAFIRIIDEDEATGELGRHYAAARKRAGKVFNVVKLQGQRPRFLHHSIALYVASMFGDSALSRGERELIAVVVSSVNACHY